MTGTAATGRKPRIGFVIEQTLGHVAYGMSLRAALAEQTDFEPVWIDVPFAASGAGRLPVVRGNWTLRGSLAARDLIRRTMDEQPLDAMFLHTQTIALFAGSIMDRVPTLLSLDATPRNVDEIAHGYQHTVRGRAIESVKHRLHKGIVRRARAYTTWSEWTKQSLVADYGADASRVLVVHPGTIVSRFEGRPGTRREGPVRLLFVGGDLQRKGGDLLLDVYRRHFGDTCELHLVTGAEVDPMPGVYVHSGLRPYAPDLLALYRDADIFVLPTRADCLAVVLGEAMSASLPIVTTGVGGHAEAVEDGASGYVIDRDDAVALRDRIERLAADPGLRARMGSRGHAIARERFDIDICAGRIAGALIALAHGDPPTAAGMPASAGEEPATEVSAA